MRLFVSVFLLAVATAGFGQSPAQPAVQQPSDAAMQPSDAAIRTPMLMADANEVSTAAAFEPLWARATMHSPLMARADPSDLRATCYTMRSYRFSRVDPKSDAMKPSGYSTCQSGAKYQLRDSSARPFAGDAKH